MRPIDWGGQPVLALAVEQGQGTLHAFAGSSDEFIPVGTVFSDALALAPMLVRDLPERPAVGIFAGEGRTLHIAPLYADSARSRAFVPPAAGIDAARTDISGLAAVVHDRNVIVDNRSILDIAGDAALSSHGAAADTPLEDVLVSSTARASLGRLEERATSRLRMQQLATGNAAQTGAVYIGQARASLDDALDALQVTVDTVEPRIWSESRWRRATRADRAAAAASLSGARDTLSAVGPVLESAGLEAATAAVHTARERLRSAGAAVQDGAATRELMRGAIVDARAAAAELHVTRRTLDGLLESVPANARGADDVANAYTRRSIQAALDLLTETRRKLPGTVAAERDGTTGALNEYPGISIALDVLSDLPYNGLADVMTQLRSDRGGRGAQAGHILDHAIQRLTPHVADPEAAVPVALDRAARRRQDLILTISQAQTLAASSYPDVQNYAPRGHARIAWQAERLNAANAGLSDYNVDVAVRNLQAAAELGKAKQPVDAVALTNALDALYARLGPALRPDASSLDAPSRARATRDIIAELLPEFGTSMRDRIRDTVGNLRRGRRLTEARVLSDNPNIRHAIDQLVGAHAATLDGLTAPLEGTPAYLQRLLAQADLEVARAAAAAAEPSARLGIVAAAWKQVVEGGARKDGLRLVDLAGMQAEVRALADTLSDVEELPEEAISRRAATTRLLLHRTAQVLDITSTSSDPTLLYGPIGAQGHGAARLAAEVMELPSGTPIPSTAALERLLRSALDGAPHTTADSDPAAAALRTAGAEVARISAARATDGTQADFSIATRLGAGFAHDRTSRGFGLVDQLTAGQRYLRDLAAADAEAAAASTSVSVTQDLARWTELRRGLVQTNGTVATNVPPEGPALTLQRTELDAIHRRIAAGTTTLRPGSSAAGDVDRLLTDMEDVLGRLRARESSRNYFVTPVTVAQETVEALADDIATPLLVADARRGRLQVVQS